MVVGVGAWKAGGIELGHRIAPLAANKPNVQAIGDLLYTRYIFLFEAAGLILLVSMIGAIVLTHRARGGVRAQNVAKQFRRRPEEATRKISQPIGTGVELCSVCTRIWGSASSFSSWACYASSTARKTVGSGREGAV